MKPKTQQKNMAQGVKIPDGWEVKTLNDTDIFSIDYGTRVVRKRDGGSKYDVYGGGGKTFFMDTYNRENQLVVARFAMSEKCTRYVSGKFFLNDSGLTVSIVNEKMLLQNYLNYYFIYLNDYIYSLGRGSAQRNLDVKKFKQIEIKYPKSLDEQKRIVGVLDEVFDKVEQAKEIAEENLKNAQELFESYLQNIFEQKGDNWEEKKLGDVCETGAGGTPLKSHKDYYENGDIPWLRSGEVSKKNITESELLITKKGLKNSSAKLFPKDTVLIAMYGATAGQVGILRFKSSTNQAVCGIFPSDDFIPEFLYYKFLAEKDELVKKAVGGAQPNISQIKIRNTKIPVLDLGEQKQIVKKLDELQEKTRGLEAILRSKIAELEKLKKSVLEKAFRGEL